MIDQEGGAKRQLEALHRQICVLERKLETYHGQLEKSLDRDRQRQLEAKWGIAESLLVVGAWVGSEYAADQWLHLHGLIYGVVVAVAGSVGMLGVIGWSARSRKSDEKGLSQLPQWEAMQ